MLSRVGLPAPRSQGFLKMDKRGRLTFIRETRNAAGRRAFECICDCGEIRIIDAAKFGVTQSCGCLNRERCSIKNKTHGLTRSQTYYSWCAMIGRCTNPNDRGWKDYGGRGITICSRWKIFQNFLDDMGICPTGHSIERQDVNGNYEPSNCIWIPKKAQAANRRTTKLITICGTLAPRSHHCAKFGIAKDQVHYYVKYRNLTQTEAFLRVLERKIDPVGNRLLRLPRALGGENG